MKDLIFDKSFFAVALREGLQDETINVLDVKNNCVSAKCLNFLSDLFKATVRYTTSSKDRDNELEHTLDIVAKTEPLNNDVVMNMVRQQNLFLTEQQILQDVLPRIERLVGRQIGPKVYYSSDIVRVIIMEDLAKRGFVIKDRQRGLSLEHCVLVMEQIARMHAGSVALFEKKPEKVSSFRDGLLSAKCPKSFFRMMEVSLINIGNVLKHWSDQKCAGVATKLIKLAETITPRCLDVYNYDADEFCVLNHGDCWVNNIMFKEGIKGEPIEAIFVDYQMSVYTSPAIDLHYFLNTCPEISVKCEKDDFLLTTYLNTLRSTMKKLGCKTEPPTMEDLKAALYKRRQYAICAGIVLYLRMIANKEDTEDFEELFGKLSGETKMDVFKNPDAKIAALKMIPVFEERGYLD